MRSSFIVRVSAGFCATALVASIAAAGDLAPPPWRGEDNSFFGVWGFPDSGTPDQPEMSAFNPPFDGAISEMVTFTEEKEAPQWLETFGGRNGVWCLPLNSGLTFRISNYENENPVKRIRVQIKYFNPGTQPGFFGRPPLVTVDPRDSEGDMTGFQILTYMPVTEQIDDFGYFLGIFDFDIFPNPAFENITIFQPKHIPAYIDQVVIDTWCVPSPAGAAVSAAVGLLALRRRRS